MSMNLLDSIKGEVNSTVIDKISNYLNIARGNTSNAITATIPTILGYLAETSKTESGANNILKVATDSELSTMFSNNSFQDLFERNRDSLMVKGNSSLIDILGGKEAKFSEEIAKHANISKEASDGILASIFPLILNVIGNKVSAEGLTSSSLTSLFDRERDSIFSAIPAGLASIGGVLGLTGLGAKTMHTTSTVTTDTVKPVVEPVKTTTTHTERKTYVKEEKDNGGGMMKWLLPLLGIIAAAALIYFLMKGCDDKKVTDDNDNIEEVASIGVAEYTLNDDKVVVNADGTPLLGANGEEMKIDGTMYKLNDENFVVNVNDGKKALDMDGKEILVVDNLAKPQTEVAGVYDSINKRFIFDRGTDTEITLPDGSTLMVGNKSTEWKLFDFLNNENNVVSDDKSQGWIVLDRVYFETGSNNLDKTSLEQLNRVAQILNAYPNAKAKLGGYTDNQGGQEINQPLSQARAEAVMADLNKAGIAADRLEAEGYGQEHFICPANDTPECMAQNRRVDIRITKK